MLEFELIIIDFFVGGGGVLMGIEMVVGWLLDVVINYDLVVIVMYVVNYLDMLYLINDIWGVDLMMVMFGWRVGVFWVLFDCKYFLKVKGGKLFDCNICDFVWVVVDWVEK